MQSGNAHFYHQHINHNIDKVQKRRDDYIKLRKQFLQKHCQPIEDKIQNYQKDIQYYEHLIKNQNQMIENQPDILTLKEQISQFLKTQKYFLSHLDEYQARIVELTYENQALAQRVQETKASLNSIAHKKYDGLFKELSQIDFRSQASGVYLQNSKVSSLEKSEHGRRGSGKLLPSIFKVENYYTKKEKDVVNGNSGRATVVKNLEKKRSFFKKPLFTSEVKQQLRTQSKISSPAIDKNQPSSSTSKVAINPAVTQKVKEIVAHFNMNELLIKQCFNTKKRQVQKHVSQLQSRLIQNRESFLEICQAVSEQEKRVSFQQFEKLTSDEIMTLLISFPWLEKKLFRELNGKRRNIMQLQADVGL